MTMKQIFLLTLVLASLLAEATAGASGSCEAPGDNRCEEWSVVWDSGRNETDRGAYPEEPTDNAVYGEWLFTVGVSAQGSDSSKAFLLQQNIKDGAIGWARRFQIDDKNGWDIANAVGVNADGSIVYVAGTSRADEFGPGDLFLGAFSATSGKRRWVKVVHQDRSWGNDLEVLAGSKGVLVSGSAGYPGRNKQTVLARYSSRGKLLWKRAIGEKRYDEFPLDLAVNGRRAAISISRRVDESHYEVFVRSFDLSGEVQWTRFYENLPGYVYKTELRYSSGRLLAFISSQDVRQTGGVAETITTALEPGTGETLWEDIATSPVTGFLPGADLAVSPDGSVAYAVGVPPVVPAEHFEEVHIRAYNASTGEIMWTIEYDSDAGDVYTTDAVARDDGVVVGMILMPGLGRDLLTISLDKADGSIAWSARYNPIDLPGAEVNGGTLTAHPDGSVFHAAQVASGNAAGGFYEHIDVVVAAYR